MSDHRSALLIVDMINAFDFEGAAALLRQTRAVVAALVRLKTRARRAACPVIYCNDNFGEWRCDFRALLENSVAEDKPGRDVVLAVALSRKTTSSSSQSTPPFTKRRWKACSRRSRRGGSFCVASLATDAFDGNRCAYS